MNAGFQECADEAIRYLIEEENFSPDDPIVVGLQEHLREKQHLLNLQQVFQCYSDAYTSEAFEKYEDSGVSRKNDLNGSVNGEDPNQLNSEHAKSCESLQNLDMTAITSLAEEILSLLHEDECLADFVDDSFSIEQ